MAQVNCSSSIFFGQHILPGSIHNIYKSDGGLLLELFFLFCLHGRAVLQAPSLVAIGGDQNGPFLLKSNMYSNTIYFEIKK